MEIDRVWQGCSVVFFRGSKGIFFYGGFFQDIITL